MRKSTTLTFLMFLLLLVVSIMFVSSFDVAITTSAQKSYVLWKEDGNAVGAPTPIHAQELAQDGLSLTGSPATLVTNDRP